MSDYKSVEELGYDDPYVDRFYTEHGFYPRVKLIHFKHLPSFYLDRYSGKEKFRMVKCAVGTHFQVTGTKKGKKVPTLILMQDEVGQSYSLEPKVFATSFLIDLEKPGTREVGLEELFGGTKKSKAELSSMREAPDPEMAALVKARKEKARICL